MTRIDDIDLNNELKIDQIFTNSINIYKTNFLYFVKLMSVFFIPGLIFIGLLAFHNLEKIQSILGTLQIEEKMRDEQLFNQFASLWGQFFLAGVVGYLGYFLSQMAVIRGAGFVINNEEVSVGDVSFSVLKMTLKLIITMILVILVMSMGFVLCIIPGIVFSIYMTFVNQINVIEEKYYVYSIVRSFSLIKNHFWKVFAIIFIYYLVYYMFSWTLQGIIMGGDYADMIKEMVKGGSDTAERISEIQNQVLHKSLIASIISFVFMLLVQPILHIALTLKFINIKKVREVSLIDSQLKSE